METLNQMVNVTSFYFPKGTLRAFPRRMEFGNNELTFTEGLRYLVCKGQAAFSLFDMSDGRSTYRLKLEGGQWTLLGTKLAG